MSKELSRDQFEVTGENTITHVPSGMILRKFHGNEGRVEVELMPDAQHGMTSSGDAFDYDAVRAMALDILAETESAVDG